MAVNNLTQLPFNTVHIQDEVGGVNNSIVIDVNDDHTNENHGQSFFKRH